VLAVFLGAVIVQITEAFLLPPTPLRSWLSPSSNPNSSPRFAEDTKESSSSSDAVFLPIESDEGPEDEEMLSDVDLDVVEKFGRGAAKVRFLPKNVFDACATVNWNLICLPSKT
jgi:hypothetical protein